MENNKLIAEFMELQINSYGDYNIDKEIMGFDMIVCSLTDTKFHTSWDWLMPVAQKIYDEKEFDNELVLLIRDSIAELNLKNSYESIIDYLVFRKKKQEVISTL